MKIRILTAVAAVSACVSTNAAEYVVAPDGVGTDYTAVAPGPLSGLGERLAADWKAADKKGRRDTVVFRKGRYRFCELPRHETRETAPAKFGFRLAGNALEIRGETGVAADVVLDGCGGEGRAFAFAGPGEVTVRGLTFRNFRTAKASGAALAFGSGPTTNLVENCTFRGNSTGGKGGATLGANCRDCVFFENAAGVAGGAGCGGVYTNCTFEANSCPTGCCSALVGDAAALRINRCVFRGNWAPLHYEGRGWQHRSHGTLYGTGGNSPKSCYITDNTIEGCGYGFHGRRDGKPGVDTVTVKPGESIVKARDFLRANRTPGKRAEIVLEDGVHMLTNCVELLGFDRDLTIRAKNAGRAHVVGGWNFRGKEMRPALDRPGLLEIAVPEAERTYFTRGSFGGPTHAFGGPYDKVLARALRPDPSKRDKKTPPTFPILTVDTAAMVPGRWPQGGKYLYIGASNIVQEAKGEGTNLLFTTFTGRERTWNWEDADIGIWGELFGCAYSKEAIPALGFDPKAGVIDFGRQKLSKTAHFFFINVPEEVDEPGEWCYDRRKGRILLCPPKGFRPDSLCVLGTHYDNFFRIASDGVRIEGLVFTGKIGGFAVAIAEGQGNALRGCCFSGIGFKAVGVAGRNNEVRSCDFEDIVSSGVLVIGGEARTLDLASNRVENCSFRHCCYGQLGGHAPVLYLCGNGNIAAHNLIVDSIAPGIGFFGTGALIEYNRTVGVTKDNGDSNAVGTGGLNAYGATIRFNDVGGSPGFSQGVYLDDFSSGVTVYGNVIRDFGQFGIFLGGGRDHVFSNNVVTAGWGGIHSDNRGLFWPAWKDKEKCWRAWCDQYGLTNASPFALKYPKFAKWWETDGKKLLTAPIGNAFVNNLFLDIKGYGSSVFVAMNRDFPRDRNISKGNLVVRSRGLRSGEYDLAEGFASNAPTNHMSSGTRNAFGPYVKLRVLDGTPEKPVDLGFVDVPEAQYDASEYMFIEQGWVDCDKLNRMRAEGRLDRTEFRRGDFNLKPDARLYKEIPGFQPIPWDKIGLYKDEWRTKID